MNGRVDGARAPSAVAGIPFILFTSQYGQLILDACRQAGASNTISQPRDFCHTIARSNYLNDLITDDEVPRGAASSYRRRPS